MNIKEMESLSGLTRANIRYYEQEGLLSPARESNGYRSYTQEDLDILLRIRLLRSLQISLETIRALQNGTEILSAALEEQLKALEQTEREAAQAQDICRAIQSDNATYHTLNAQKYLSGWTPDRPTYAHIPAEDEIPLVSHPWRRFFARALDVLLYSCIWNMFLSLFHVNITAQSTGLTLLDSIITILLMLFLEPLLLHLFGTTLGKWIFGLYLEDEYGRRPSYGDCFSRTWRIFGSGYGYGLPIYRLICLWRSYRRCRDHEAEPWEDDPQLVYSIRDTRWYRPLAFIGANALLIFFLCTAVLSSRLPPNRGDLTVAEFAENYNMLANYYNDTGRLDSDGRWMRKQPSGYDTVIRIGSLPEHEFEYTVRDGILTEVTIHIDMKQSDSRVINNFTTEMFLSSFSLVGAQKDLSLFSKAHSRIAQTIKNHPFEDFSISEAGVLISYKVEYTGYRNIGNYLTLLDHAPTGSYSMVFSISKP